MKTIGELQVIKQYNDINYQENFQISIDTQLIKYSVINMNFKMPLVMSGLSVSHDCTSAGMRNSDAATMYYSITATAAQSNYVIQNEWKTYLTNRLEFKDFNNDDNDNR